MKVVVLTGAGISAESGLPTFRDADGLWEGHDPMTVATPEAFEDDPDLVQRFYDERRAALGRVEPNAAHVALARLEEHLGDDLYLVTQNIDDLHERGGSTAGAPHARPAARRLVHDLRPAARVDRHPASTGRRARPAAEPTLRPDVVWFGEVPYDMDAVQRALFECDLFVAIGTSGLVYPAAAFVHYAIGAGADTLELNLAPDAVSDFAQVRQGPATQTVPAWVDGA